MYRKIANTFCKVLIYMIAFVVAALMGIMLIHILMESIPALREVGIKMFLPSSEWRPAFLLFSCQRNLHLSAWPL